jgi:hypothetical protein
MTIKARFDGKVLVPDEPLDLEKDQKVAVTIEPLPFDDKQYWTGADLVRYIEAHPEISEYWNRVAAGRDSTEVARELRMQAQTRGLSNDSD